ncbi:PQQ-dependent sugar dehydrogenase [Tunicatimonas pelagia]|uniref:PQQ-dependent sugar dehydrogenase n=1 Tax=Tunicatimonas pelagia TaxID=931531 RepID=UPI002665B7C8|nr:PQQ-dependent sugar dehydrogenase [Tunicatimonas pelagia]WKN44591.1 PQQ-dependent sugar dehydrogenase [Tunicatimonas pelagia]
MPRYVLPLLVLITLSLFFLTSCGSSQSQEASAQDSPEVSFVRDELSVQHGQELFNQHCAACHNFQETNIGPNLSGVTSSVDKDWLVSFISNAPEMIDSGDERAQQLFKKYNLYMPAFTMLDNQQIEHILGFIHKFSQGQKKSQNNRPGGILNPVKEKIPVANLRLVLEEVLTLPASDTASPLARINKLLAIESSQGERLFIHDLRGKLYEITDRSTSQAYLDMNSEYPDFIHVPGYGTGLGSFAFHPDFEQNGLLYTTHTEPANAAPADFPLPDSIDAKLQWVLVEWKADDPKTKGFSGAQRELLRVDMVSHVHGFQEITFNPLAQPGEADYGLLYLGMGDGGAGMRYPFLCDTKEQIWTSVIRIDPLGENSANGQYGIPDDNPFINEPTAVHEVWARGFRNAHRISWDRTGSGKMFISNIGQHSVEEVNLGVAGGDYGWPNREGVLLFDPMANPELVYPLPANDSGYVYPVAQYDHDEGNAISGGFAYAGTEVPLLKGKYIFGDIPRGKIFYSEVDAMELGQQAQVYQLSIEFEGQTTDLPTLTQSRRVDLRFGLDGAGELYLFTKANGALYKVIDCKDTSALAMIDD